MILGVRVVAEHLDQPRAVLRAAAGERVGLHRGVRIGIGVLRDFHGVDGVALSVPSVVSASGADPIHETQFDHQELELLHRSATALREVVDSLRE